MTIQRWDRAALASADADRRTPAVVALDPGLPTLGELFEFMRDAETRFETLRMRIEERSFTARGEVLTAIDVALAHPGHARVTTSEVGRPAAGNFELWLSDGATVRTYSGAHRLGTERPVRNRPRGLDDGFPGTARVYTPITALPLETLPELFVHPAGYCQNVLSSGRTWISGTDAHLDREVIVVECDHPRTIERIADRPDFHVQVAVDRADGVILRLVETIGGDVTREARVTAYDPNATLAPATFEFAFPEGTTRLY